MLDADSDVAGSTSGVQPLADGLLHAVVVQVHEEENLQQGTSCSCQLHLGYETVDTGNQRLNVE